MAAFLKHDIFSVLVSQDHVTISWVDASLFHQHRDKIKPLKKERKPGGKGSPRTKIFNSCLLGWCLRLENSLPLTPATHFICSQKVPVPPKSYIFPAKSIPQLKTLERALLSLPSVLGVVLGIKKILEGHKPTKTEIHKTNYIAPPWAMIWVEVILIKADRNQL